MSCRCKFKCREKFEEKERNYIFREYWSLGSHERQRDYTRSHVLRINKKRRTRDTVNSRRTYTLLYHLPKDGKQIPVCAKFFLGTLNIGKKTVHYTIELRKK